MSARAKQKRSETRKEETVKDVIYTVRHGGVLSLPRRNDLAPARRTTIGQSTYFEHSFKRLDAGG